MKFRYLKIDLSSATTYNCHAASPHPVDFAWLSKNPGELFNTPINVTERQMMLDNQRNSSCEQNCWAAEDRGAISPRMYQGGTKFTHSEISTSPEILDITVGSDCNLTCSYCCKEFSSAWRRDIISNGNYLIPDPDERYQLSVKDKILNKISQNEIKDSEKYKILLNEIQASASTLKRLDITGGEPFLNNQLISTLASLELGKDCQIRVYTGLGVSVSRFKKLIAEISKCQNLVVIVSAENIGSFLEFNRYGTKWSEFQEKLEILTQQVDWKFHCTLSNLSVLGFREFLDFFPDQKFDLTFAHQPRFMSPHVLDDQTKDTLSTQFRDGVDAGVRDQIMKSISPSPSDLEKDQIQHFLTQFVQRRSDLSFDIFPASFLEWLGIKHVVQ